MRKRMLVGAALAAALTLTAVPAQALNSTPFAVSLEQGEVRTLAQARQYIVNETNAARVKKGLPAVVQSSLLTQVSQAWSDRQARANHMAHNPSAGSQLPRGWSRWAENVAAGYDYTTVVAAWLKSPGHYANIVNPQLTHIGVGIAYAASGRAYFTQNFAAYRTSPDKGVSPISVAPIGTKTSRIAGDNRYATSLKILAQYSSAETVYIASGTVFADALSASAIAGRNGDPVVITAPTAPPANLVSAIARLKPQRIVVMGGKGAVSDTIIADLTRLLPTAKYVRIAGDNRYDTAHEAVDRLWTGQLEHAYLAVGSNYPDALAAAPAAIKEGATVIPVSGSVPSAELLALLDRKGVTSATIVGSTGVIPASFEKALKTQGMAVTRLGGANRYATAEAVALHAFPGTQATAYIATGANFADALAAAALAGRTGSPMMLAPTVCLTPGTAAYLKASRPAQAVLLGGVGVVSKAIERHLLAC